MTLERQSGGHENTFGRRQQVPQSAGGAGVDCRAGYQVISTADGEQALRLARELTPALILLDVILPKMSGLCFNSKSVQFPARSMPLEH